jgi:BlaI family transcriptional regulator, penicillinase repressor
MARPKAGQLTPLELDIMNVLWRLGDANVQAVQQALHRELAYTTVQTVLNILHRKRKVKRAKRDRAFFYTPVVSQSQVAHKAVTEMVERLFGGSAESLVMSLLEARQLTPQKLDRLKRLVLEAREEGEQK